MMCARACSPCSWPVLRPLRSARSWAAACLRASHVRDNLIFTFFSVLRNAHGPAAQLGLFEVDICGPSVPKLVDLKGQISATLAGRPCMRKQRDRHVLNLLQY